MKKQIAIFALLTFFFAQFGKVINYAFCKAEAYLQTNTFVCDCEKQLYTATGTDTASSEKTPASITAAFPTEELFHLPEPYLFNSHCSTTSKNWVIGNSEALYHSFCMNIFRPPLQCA